MIDVKKKGILPFLKRQLQDHAISIFLSVFMFLISPQLAFLICKSNKQHYVLQGLVYKQNPFAPIKNARITIQGKGVTVSNEQGYFEFEGKIDAPLLPGIKVLQNHCSSCQEEESFEFVVMDREFFGVYSTTLQKCELSKNTTLDIPITINQYANNK